MESQTIQKTLGARKQKGRKEDTSTNIIYSYKYLESDLIERSTAPEEIPRKFPREPHVFPIIVTSLDSIDNKHGVHRQVRRCRRRGIFIYFIEYFRKASGILLLGVWCKNIRYNIPIITLVGVWPDGLSPHGWPYFSLGDKPSGHTPTRVIIV